MRADIHDGQEQETLRAMGRIQMRETNYLQIVKSGLHRTAGPYRSATSGLCGAASKSRRELSHRVRSAVRHQQTRLLPVGTSVSWPVADFVRCNMALNSSLPPVV